MTNLIFQPKPTTVQPVASLQKVGWLPHAALANGIRIIGASGSGKTQLGVWMLFSFFMQQRPFLVFDPTKSLIRGFLSWVQHYCESNHFSERRQQQLYQRIVYFDLSGQSGYVMPFSLFRRYGQEPLSAVADRVMSWVSGNFASSHSAPVEGYSSIVKLLYPASIIAAALQPDIQVTELPDLLRHPDSGRWKQRFAQAVAKYPFETAEAVAYFQNEYVKLDKSSRERRLNLLEVVLQPFRYTLPIRATFGASHIGLDYDQIIQNRQIVLIDASNLAGEYQQQILNWILLYSFPPYLRVRGSGQHEPIGLMIDEISTFYLDSPESMAVFANRFGEMVHVLRRQYGIHPLCVIHQTVAQLHEKIAGHLAALGNQIVGKPADYESALMLSEQLFAYRTYVKRWEPVHMNLPEIGPQVVDFRPQEFNRQEIVHIQAQNLLRLKKLHFLAKLTRTEGGGQARLRTLNISPLLGPWPDAAKVHARCQELAAASGLPIQQILTEIEERKQPVVNGNQQSGTMPKYDKDGYLISE